MLAFWSSMMSWVAPPPLTVSGAGDGVQALGRGADRDLLVARARVDRGGRRRALDGDDVGRGAGVEHQAGQAAVGDRGHAVDGYPVKRFSDTAERVRVVPVSVVGDDERDTSSVGVLVVDDELGVRRRR